MKSLNWSKLGKVFCPSGETEWGQTHAYIPTAVELHGEIRIFCAFWDKNKVGRLGYVDVREDDPTKILKVSKQPVLDVGQPGTFDCAGVSPSCIVKQSDERLFLFYLGWQKGTQVRYFLFGGLAVSNDGGEHFERVKEVPILDRTSRERYMRSAPWVIREGSIYKMWYVASNEWIKANGKEVPTYEIRYLESSNIVKWGDKGETCLELQGKEFGLGRPFVYYESGIYKMIYSRRLFDKGYRLGYAESQNGVDWIRQDNKIDLGISEDGWDSEMICFAYPLNNYIFYNGNNYGETGFGVALAKDK